ncbi:MAG: hypothetical protein HY549_02470 [Elusimicrobia bacterium]|nr:hypothetical protein [Elusimicrobiota bacterium]
MARSTPLVLAAALFVLCPFVSAQRAAIRQASGRVSNPAAAALGAISPLAPAFLQHEIGGFLDGRSSAGQLKTAVEKAKVSGPGGALARPLAELAPGFSKSAGRAASEEELGEVGARLSALEDLLDGTPCLSTADGLRLKDTLHWVKSGLTSKNQEKLVERARRIAEDLGSTRDAGEAIGDRDIVAAVQSENSSKRAPPEGSLQRYQQRPKVPTRGRFGDIPSPETSAGGVRAPEEIRLPNDARTVERRVFAVHATTFLPADGVMRAGASVLAGDKRTINTDPPSFRPTLHFALGELVQPLEKHSWEDRPYAVVLPLGALKSQLANLNTYDTFILGDLKLLPETIVVVPAGDEGRIPTGVGVETYDKSKETLRQAVDRTIQKYGGWPIRMEHDRSGLDSLATVGGINVNTPEFFGPFLKENPRVSFGGHIQSQLGTAYRFGVAEDAITRMTDGFQGIGPMHDAKQLDFYRKVAEYHLSRLEAELLAAGWPEASMRTFREKHDKARKWLDFIAVDREVQASRGLTLQRAPAQILHKAKSLRGDPAALKAFIENNAGRLREAPQTSSLNHDELVYSLASSPPSEMQDLTRDLVAEGLLTPARMEQLRAWYAFKRAMRIDLARAREEGLIAMMTGALESLSGWERNQGVLGLENRLEQYLDERSTRLNSALELLKVPQIRAAVEDLREFRLPPPERLTLQSLLRVHPMTKGAFRSRGGAGPAARILDTLDPGAARPSHFRSFQEAYSAAITARAGAEHRGKRLKEVATPLRDASSSPTLEGSYTPSFYAQLRSGTFGSINDVWGKLGLQNEFRRKFPSDDDFWRSEKSMAQLYANFSQELLDRRR